jgi:cytochrome b561
VAASRYTTTAIILHWGLALLIAVNVALAWSFDHLPDRAVRPVIDMHKSIGITVLGLAMLRVLWRYLHPPPALDPAYAAWERRSARWVHGLLYLLLFAMPVSGWLHDSAWKDAATHPMFLFGFIPWPRIQPVAALNPALKESLHTLFGRVHTAFAYALYGLFVMHVSGALKHQFLDGQPELQRIWPERLRRTAPRTRNKMTHDR